MTSVGPHMKTIPSEGAYFIALADISNKVYNYQPANIGTSQPFTGAVTWTGTSSPLAQGAILKDLGKTVVSSLRTFRKVQLVTSSLSSGVTVGAPVNGLATATGEEYLTGYIELPGQNGTGRSGQGLAAVARLG